jgi:large subunit ribosomal protein L5
MQFTLQDHYKQIIPQLMKELGVTNPHQVPKLEKIVLNCSIGSHADRKIAIEDAVNDMATITGQKPIIANSKKAIANFKLRAGEPLGCKVTLRGVKMYDFLMRLVKTAMPRIRDFRGITPRGFDGRGNFTLGIKDQSIFPEIELEKVKRQLGYDITFVTTATSDEAALTFLKAMGMPFRMKPAAAQSNTPASN